MEQEKVGRLQAGCLPHLIRHMDRFLKLYQRIFSRLKGGISPMAAEPLVTPVLVAENCEKSQRETFAIEMCH